MIDILRKKLKSMEDSKRFSGNSYPQEYVQFPKILIGQGFFPGGDGLWRDDNPQKMREASPYAFPKNGIMFLGNDFGSLAGFVKLKLHENPPTWRNLRRRLVVAKIPGEIGFYTNAYLGLRSDRDALAEALVSSEYESFCKEFLEFQISTQAPRLIVVLGDRPSNLLHQILQYPIKTVGEIANGQMSGFVTTIMTATHPYSDLNKDDAAMNQEGLLLKQAWLSAISDREQ
jgi:hypothetical protein